jgi:signal transduction histidine kinase
MKTLRRSIIHGSSTPWEILYAHPVRAREHRYVVVMNAAGYLVAASDAWHRYAAGRWTWRRDQTVQEVQPSAGQATAWKNWSEVFTRALTGKHAFETSWRTQSRMDGAVVADSLAQPLHDDNGSPQGAVIAGRLRFRPLAATSSDEPPPTPAETMLITTGAQIIALEAELRRAQRLATQGMAAAAVGHELTNCLLVALGNASLFLEHNIHNREAVKAIEPVIHALETSGSICHRFRELGRPANAAVPLIDLRAVVKQGYAMLARIVGRKLEFDADGPELLVRAARPQIEQMLVNLVFNARDATHPKTGAITIAVGSQQIEGKPHHWFEVIDNGRGISPSTRKKLFTVYFTTKPDKRGTGLGLAAVMTVTRSLGGRVTLTSKPGRGTRVRVALPKV